MSTLITFAEAQRLSEVVTSKIPVKFYDDHLLIHTIVEVANRIRQDFFDKFVQDASNLTTEQSKELDVKYCTQTADASSFQVFTREELHNKIDGQEWSYYDRQLLEKYLVKENKKGRK